MIDGMIIPSPVWPGKTLAAMKDNPLFPDPKPVMATYKELVNDYKTKHEVAATRGSQLEKKAWDSVLFLVYGLSKDSRLIIFGIIALRTKHVR